LQRHSLSSPEAPFQKPFGIVRCKRLIPQRRNRPGLPFRKQVFVGGSGRSMMTGGRVNRIRKEGMLSRRGLPFLLHTYCTVRVTKPIAVVEPEVPVTVMV
jgi:hypothetical protein